MVVSKSGKRKSLPTDVGWTFSQVRGGKDKAKVLVYIVCTSVSPSCHVKSLPTLIPLLPAPTPCNWGGATHR